MYIKEISKMSSTISRGYKFDLTEIIEKEEYQRDKTGVSKWLLWWHPSEKCNTKKQIIIMQNSELLVDKTDNPEDEHVR